VCTPQALPHNYELLYVWHVHPLPSLSLSLSLSLYQPIFSNTWRRLSSLSTKSPVKREWIKSNIRRPKRRWIAGMSVRFTSARSTSNAHRSSSAGSNAACVGESTGNQFPTRPEAAFGAIIRKSCLWSDHDRFCFVPTEAGSETHNRTITVRV